MKKHLELAGGLALIALPAAILLLYVLQVLQAAHNYEVAMSGIRQHAITTDQTVALLVLTGLTILGVFAGVRLIRRSRIPSLGIELKSPPNARAKPTPSLPLRNRLLGRRILYWVILLAVLGVAFFAWEWSVTEEPLGVASAYQSAINRGNFQEAYSHFSPSMRRRVSQEQLEDATRKYPQLMMGTPSFVVRRVQWGRGAWTFDIRVEAPPELRSREIRQGPYIKIGSDEDALMKQDTVNHIATITALKENGTVIPVRYTLQKAADRWEIEGFCVGPE